MPQPGGGVPAGGGVEGEGVQEAGGRGQGGGDRGGGGQQGLGPGQLVQHQGHLPPQISGGGRSVIAAEVSICGDLCTKGGGMKKHINFLPSCTKSRDGINQVLCFIFPF